MTSRTVLVLCSMLLCVALLFSGVSAEGRVLLDFLDPATNDGVTFSDPVHVVDARVQSVNTESFKLVNQYNLNAELSVIELASTSSTNGISVASDLGAAFQSDNDVSVDSGQSIVFSANTADLDAVDKTALTSANGNLTLSSGVRLSMRARDTSITATSNGVSINSEGDVEMQSFNNVDFEAGAATSFSYLKNIQLTSSNGDIDIAAGQALSISSPTTIGVDGHKVLSFSSNGLTNFNASRTLRLSGEHFFAQSFGDATITSTQNINVQAARDVFMKGNQVNAVAGKGLNIRVDSPNAVVGFTGAGNLVTNAGALPQSFVIKASGIGGIVQLAAAGDSNIDSKTLDVTATADLNLGSAGTPVLDLEAATTLSVAGTTLTSDSVKTFELNSAATLAMSSTNDRVKYQTPSANFAATGALSLTGTTIVDITSELSDPILLSSAHGVTFSANTDIQVAADAAVRIQSQMLHTATAKVVTIVSGGGHDVTFSSVAGKTTQILAANQLTMLSNRVVGTFNAMTVTGKTYEGKSLANFDGQTVKANNVSLTSTNAAFSSKTTGGDLLIHGVGDNAIIDARATTTMTVESTADRVLMFAGDAVLKTGTGAMTFTATQTKTGEVTFAGRKGATIDGKTGLTVENKMGVSSMLGSDVSWADQKTSTLTYLGPSFGDVARQLSFVSAGVVSIGANNNQATTFTSDKHIDINAGQNALVQSVQTSGTLTADELLRIKADLGDLLVETAGGDLTFVITDDSILVEAHGAYRSTSRAETQYKAGSDILLHSDATITSNSAGVADILGGEVYIASGELKDITVTATNTATFTANTGADQAIYVDGRRFSVTGTTLAEIEGGHVEMNAVDTQVDAVNTNFQAAKQSAVNTDKLFVNATVEYNVKGPLVHIKSGLDHNVTVISKRELPVTAANSIITIGEGNVTYVATDDIDIKTNTQDVIFTGTSNVDWLASRRIALLAGNTDSDEAFKIAAGGAFHGKSDNGTDTRVIAKQNLFITSAGRQHYLGLGQDINKCGVHLRTKGAFTSTSSIGELYLAGKRCVNLTSVDTKTANNDNALISMQSTRDTFIHAEDGAVVLQSDGDDGANAMRIKTTVAAGNIEIAATEAHVKLSAQTAASATSNTKDIDLFGDGGVDVRATLQGGDVQFKMAKLFIDGARGVNISAGAEVPASKGALAVSSTGLMRFQADSDIEFRSLGPVTGGIGIELSTAGAAVFRTQNGYDFDISASRDVTFQTTANQALTIQSNGGDVEFDSDAGKVVMKGDSFQTTAADGPVHISAGGFSGSVDFESSAKHTTVTSGGDMRVTSNGRSLVTLNDKTLTVQSKVGRVDFATKRSNDDIVLLAQFLIDLKNNDDRTTPEDLIAIRGNNVEYDGTTTTATDPAIQLLTDKTLWVGANTNPVFLINAGIDAANNDLGFQVKSTKGALKFAVDADLNVFGTEEVSFAGDGALELNSIDDMIFTSTGSPATADISFASGTSLQLQGHGVEMRATNKFQVLGKRTTTVETVGIEEGDVLEMITRTPAVPIKFHADKPDAGILTTTGDTFRITPDTPLAIFLATNRQLHLRSQANTDDDDQDPANINLATDANLLVKGEKSIRFKTEDNHADLVFQTHGTESDIELNLESADQPVTFDSTRGEFVVDASTIELTAVTTDVSFVTTADPVDVKQSNILVEADGAITYTSTVMTFDIQTTGATGDIRIETTKQQAPVKFIAGAATGQLLIDSLSDDINVNVAPYSGGELTFNTAKAYELKNIAGTAEGIFVDSDNDVKMTMLLDVNIKSETGLISFTSGTLAVQGQDTVKIKGDVNSDVRFTTTGQDAKLSIVGVDTVSFLAGTGADTDDLTVVASDQITFTSPSGNNGITMQSTTKDINVLAPQGEVRTSAQDFLPSQKNLVMRAAGYDALKQYGVLLETQGTTFKFNTPKDLQLSAEDVIDVTATNDIKLESAGGSNIDIIANGEAGRIVTTAGTTLTVAATTLVDIKAGNAASFISGSTMLVKAPGITFKTTGKQSGINVETTSDSVDGAVSVAAGGSITLASGNVNIESNSPGARNGDVNIVAPTFLATVTNSDPKNWDVILSADTGDVHLSVGDPGVVISTKNLLFSPGAEFVMSTSTGTIRAQNDLTMRADYVDFRSGNGGSLQSVTTLKLTTDGHREESDDIRFTADSWTFGAAAGALTMTTLTQDGLIEAHVEDRAAAMKFTPAGALSTLSDGGQRYIFQDTVLPSNDAARLFTLRANTVMNLLSTGDDSHITIMSDKDLVINAATVQQGDRNTKVAFFEVEPQHWRQVSPIVHSTCAETYALYHSCQINPGRDDTGDERALVYQGFGDKVHEIYTMVEAFGFLPKIGTEIQVFP